MQILMSCAKDMKSDSNVTVGNMTEPAFQKFADHNARQLMNYSVDELQLMLGCNARIAAANKLRYDSFFDGQRKCQAVFSYTGIAYKYLGASEFDGTGIDYAQRHLLIASFLYGLLRPLDGICNYRLEGNVWLPDNGGVDLFDFWKPLLTDWLIETVKGDDGVLLNLASEEMKSLFDWKRVLKAVRVVQPEFKVNRNGTLKTVVVYAKMCRGAMARHVIVNGLTDVDDIKSFAFEGFEWRNVTKNRDGGEGVLFVME